METLQEQLTVVNAKIEAIYAKIEAISEQVAELLDVVRPTVELNNVVDQGTPAPMTAHRDILMDERPTAIGHSNGQVISHELQMQRLMAQLTAAYNRIAALEEQLLSQRFS